MNRPVGIDLFAGAGGLSLGFEQAGFDVVVANEIDPVHSAVHAFNFPDCLVIPEPVESITGERIRREAELGDDPVHVVFGGAPCQGFSLIGQRALDDPRNALVKHFVRLVHELDAAYFVFENVKGLTLGRHKKFLAELIDELESVGYHVRLPWRVLNASAFDVPQSRERLFLMGAREGLRLPDYPAPTTTEAGIRNRELELLPFGPSCQDAIGDLPEAEEFEELLDSDEVRTSAWGEPSSYALSLRCLAEDSWKFGYQRRWDRDVLTASMRTNHTDISRRRFSRTEPGSVEPISRFYRLPADGVANTLRAGTNSARGAFTSPRPIHYSQPRCVTVREMARLHGFPDWFRFHRTKWHGARQIGNAVPPPLAEAVASSIMAALGLNPSKPSETVPLGDSDLLSLTMQQAADYWHQPVVIGGRDRKSGDTKRTQEEIEAELSYTEAE